jgi:exopolysaccharide production protein ExoQ
MTVAQHARFAGDRYLMVDTSEWLTCLALMALALNAFFGTLAAAIFLLAGGLLVISNVPASIRALVGQPLMLILPAYCLLSTFWSQFSDLTLRYSVQLAITIAIAVVIAARVSPRLLLRILFVTYWVGVILSLLIGNHSSSDPWRGIFGSKNAFGAHIAVFALICLAVALDRLSSRGSRLMAVIGLLISGPLLVKAQSVGALVAIVPCVAVMLMVLASGRLTARQKLFAGIMGALAAAAAALFVIVNHEAIMATALSDTGKDPTLTGRTDLWATGMEFISEHPWLGVGFHAFWVKGYAPAEQLWAMFGEVSGAGFNFHDLYISNTVELGLIGICIEVAMIYGGLFLIGALAIVRPSPANALLLGLHLLLVLRSFIEVEVFFEFSIRTILAVCTLIYAMRGLADWRRESRGAAAERQFSRNTRARYIREAWRQGGLGAFNDGR